MLAPVAGRPFLTHLLDRLARASVREVVLLTGHAAEQVRAVLGDRHGGMRLTYSVEPAPLGTAGAVRHALPHFQAETVLLLNGDSYCDADLWAFRQFHAEKEAGASLVLTRVADASRFGQIEVADDGRVIRFAEKGPSGAAGWINAGIYLFPRAAAGASTRRPTGLAGARLVSGLGRGAAHPRLPRRGAFHRHWHSAILCRGGGVLSRGFRARRLTARGGGRESLMLDDVDLLVCGAGPVGCVIAERAATVLGWNVLVVDQRRHVAGNCYDSRHQNGVLIHNYGPHYFRTNDASLLKYLSRFTEWLPARYEVKSCVGGREAFFPFPINLTTLEQFFGRDLDAESRPRRPA